MPKKLESPASLIERISHSWIRRYRPQSQSTDWGQTLAMYGLLKTLRKKEDPLVREYLRTWLAFHMSERLRVDYFCGSWSFGLLYPDVIEEFPEMQVQLRDTAERIHEFIMHKALRNGDGVLLHNVDLPNIYIDTLYYSTVLLAKIGTTLGREWEDEAMKQVDAHLAILRDGSKPFYIHCEENNGGKRSEGSWARGNGWVMMTLAEIIPMLSKKSPHRKKLMKHFDEIAAALASVQTKRGLWRTILDDKSAYEETSASAMYLYAFQRAKNFGLLTQPFDDVIAKAHRVLIQSVDSEDRFIGVSEGTWPGTIAYYKSLSTGEWWWGTGAYLLALSEME